jgi:hypothetical protein
VSSLSARQFLLEPPTINLRAETVHRTRVQTLTRRCTRARVLREISASERVEERTLRGASRKRSFARVQVTFDRTSRLLTLRSASHLLAAPCWHVHVRCIDVLRRLVRRCERGIIAVPSSFRRMPDVGRLDARGRS